jgi:predicted DNA-binding protein
MSDKVKQDRIVGFRLPRELERDLQTIARKESNPQSAVVRRILKKGLEEELKKG